MFAIAVLFVLFLRGSGPSRQSIRATRTALVRELARLQDKFRAGADRAPSSGLLRA